MWWNDHLGLHVPSENPELYKCNLPKMKIQKVLNYLVTSSVSTVSNLQTI